MQTHVRRFIGLLLLLVVNRQAAFGADRPSDLEVTAPADGKVFRLVEARGRFVVLHFLLRTDCPFCRRHTREFAEKAGLLGSDVEQVFLKPDAEEEIRRWHGGLEGGGRVGVRVYRDPEARWAKAFGIPGGYRFHGEVGHYPALIVLDPEGREVFRHVGKNNTDRVRFDDLAARLAGWRRR